MSTESQEIETVEKVETQSQPAETTNNRREALEKAVEQANLREQQEKKKLEEPEKKEEPPLLAPAEWEQEDKEDFKSLTRKQQEASLKLHNKRQRYFDAVRREAEEVHHLRQIEQDITPYLQAMDKKGVDPRTAMFKAIQLYKAAESTPDEFVAEFVKAKQLEGWTKAEAKEQAQKIILDPSTQERINQLESELSGIRESKDRDTQEQFKTAFESHWNDFENATNDAGQKKYPDLNNSEQGIKLASNIGSLIGGQTELSIQFLNNVRNRNPEATYADAIAEAYKYFGGKVSESPQVPKVLKVNQQKNSNLRAAASIPGRVALHAKADSSTPTYATRKDAIWAALRKHSGE
jgi:hypothetical protein